MTLWPPRARAIPFVPGGPFDIATIWGLYRTVREYRDIHAAGRRRITALAAAIAIDLAAWRYSRALQNKQPEQADGQINGT